METATEIKSKAFNEDCLPAMKQYADKHFDLALVDPQYGIKITREQMGSYVTKQDRRTWDNEPPSEEYFQELVRISKYQIIFGANYFMSMLPFNSRCWIVWDKGEMMYGRDFAEVELAWTSFDKPSKIYKHHAQKQPDRIHPTQKPVKLYDRIYRDFLPEGGRVLDSHLGSGSNRIASHRAGNIEFTGFEIDREYFEAQEKRFRNFISQQTLFNGE